MSEGRFSGVGAAKYLRLPEGVDPCRHCVKRDLPCVVVTLTKAKYHVQTGKPALGKAGKENQKTRTQKTADERCLVRRLRQVSWGSVEGRRVNKMQDECPRLISDCS